MTDTLRVTLEAGPKGKKVVAVAPDWPGLERGAKTEESAVATLEAYLPRYAKVVKLAGMAATFPARPKIQVAERYTGTGSTDFWGISFAFSKFDRAAMSREELERELKLMQGCWKTFDAVRTRVSPQLRPGPRGGGRERDEIVRHVEAVEQDWATKVEVRSTDGAVVLDEAGLMAYRDAYSTAIRSFHAAGKPARTWPLRFLIRHTAFHTMDHTWEMEDRDLTPSAG